MARLAVCVSPTGWHPGPMDLTELAAELEDWSDLDLRRIGYQRTQADLYAMGPATVRHDLSAPGLAEHLAVVRAVHGSADST